MKNSLLFISIVLFVVFAPQGVFALDAGDAPLRIDLVISQVNTQRAANNLPAFEQNEALMRAAQLKAEDIARQGVLEHTPVSPKGLWWPLERVGYVYESAGENLSEGIEDSKLLVSYWMDSPEHRVNILNSNYSQIGVGIATGIFSGETVSFVVEYTAKPKLVTNQNQPVTNTASSVRSITPAVTNISASDLEVRKNLLKQLITLLTQYLNLLMAQQKP